MDSRTKSKSPAYVKKRNKETYQLPQEVVGKSDFLRRVADITPSLITVYNVKTGKYIFVNKAVKTMLGYEQSEWLKKGVTYIARLIHPDDYERIMDENNAAIANVKRGKDDQVTHFEYRVKHKNKSWRWLQTHGTLFDKDRKGQVLHVLNVSLDITERKEMEQGMKKTQEELRKLNNELKHAIANRTHALSESEMRLKEAQRITNMGSWEFDLVTGKISWSDEIFRIHGVKKGRGEPSYKDFIRLFLEPDVLKKHIKQAITKGVPYKIDTPIILPDKRIRYIQAIGRPVSDSTGKVVKLYGTAIDITDRKLSELRTQFLSEAGELLASSIDYKTTFQNIMKAAVPAIADWCVLDLRRPDGSFERVLVVHKDAKKAGLARQLQEKYPPSVRSPGGAGKVLRTGVPELRSHLTPKQALKTARGNPKMLSLLQKLGLDSFIIVPLITQNIVQGAITFASGATTRTYGQEDVQMAQELARRISLAIENASLYRQAQKAVTIRDEFISIASHELKTPVTSMKMYVQILEKMLEKNGDTENLRYLKKITEQIDKQTALVSDLLDVSKLQLGKLEFKEEIFSLDEVLVDVVDAVQFLSPKHSISITGSSGVVIRGDRDRIAQVVINLLNNAVKYSPNADKIIIKVLQKKGTISVSVKDFGIGIAKENIRKIFGRFYQVEEAAGKTYPGLGIGLYISHEIIKRHGGNISVRSEVGRGSTFSFTVPSP